MAPVDPTVSERYRWEECGRIEPAAGRPLDALYAPDGSIVFVDERGGIRSYEAGGTEPARVLVEPFVASRSFSGGLALSANGARLLRWYENELDVYAVEDGGPIGTEGGPLVPVAHVDRSGMPCELAATLSSDGESIVAHGANNVCVWDAANGELRSNILLPDDDGRYPVVGVGAEGGPVRVLRDRRLLTYTLAGAPADSVAVAAAATVEHGVVSAAFTADASMLLALIVPGSMGNPWDLVAIETQNGSERWRAPVDSQYASMALSTDGYVLVTRDRVYRIDDGDVVRDDARTPEHSTTLAPGARKKLVLGELVAERDLEHTEHTTLYGSHTRHVTALDVSRDGNYFASHADSGVLWKLAASFADSEPLVQGHAADSSWNVAIAPDGRAMTLSGDNIAFVARDDTYVSGSASASALACLSPDWSFSPDGRFAAGSHYDEFVEVRDTRKFLVIRGVTAKNCGGGVAFSPDSTRMVTASLQLFDTATWAKVWDHAPSDEQPRGLDAESAVEFSPDGREIVVTRCLETPSLCDSERYRAGDGSSLGALPELRGDRVRYSPEGHWVVSGARLLHLPLGTSLEYSSDATVAAFTPDGGIIAGTADGSLVRYCRSGR
jgi:WD40 repeat protein